MTEPENIRLVIVKIETSEPGLYGVGCATFTQRPSLVKLAIEEYLAPFVTGKSVNDIEDIWASSYVSSYFYGSYVPLSDSFAYVSLSL